MLYPLDQQIYFLNLDYFEKGNVEYSFKIVVSTEPTYNILDLVKYKMYLISQFLRGLC